MALTAAVVLLLAPLAAARQWDDSLAIAGLMSVSLASVIAVIFLCFFCVLPSRFSSQRDISRKREVIDGLNSKDHLALSVGSADRNRSKMILDNANSNFILSPGTSVSTMMNQTTPLVMRESSAFLQEGSNRAQAGAGGRNGKPPVSGTPRTSTFKSTFPSRTARGNESDSDNDDAAKKNAGKGNGDGIGVVDNSDDSDTNVGKEERLTPVARRRRATKTMLPVKTMPIPVATKPVTLDQSPSPDAATSSAVKATLELDDAPASSSAVKARARRGSDAAVEAYLESFADEQPVDTPSSRVGAEKFDAHDIAPPSAEIPYGAPTPVPVLTEASVKHGISKVETPVEETAEPAVVMFERPPGLAGRLPTAAVPPPSAAAPTTAAPAGPKPGGGGGRRKKGGK